MNESASVYLLDVWWSLGKEGHRGCVVTCCNCSTCAHTTPFVLMLMLISALVHCVCALATQWSFSGCLCAFFVIFFS